MKYPRGMWVFPGKNETEAVQELLLQQVIYHILNDAEPSIDHNKTVGQIEGAFKKRGFYTTREYQIYKMNDGSDRSGRIDLVARKGKFRVAVEYDHHGLIKWKSFQKIVQIKPECAIAITGMGNLHPNLERAEKYRKYLKSKLYVISLKEKKFELMKPVLDSGI